MRPTAAVVVAAVACVLLLFALGWIWLTRRNTVRRLTSLVARLDDEGGELVGKGGVERVLPRVERAAEAAVTERGNARRARDRLEGALEAVAPGVVVCDEAGEVVFRNQSAVRLMEIREAEATVERTTTELLQAAVEGSPGSQTLDVFGPPHRTLVVTAAPLDDG